MILADILRNTSRAQESRGRRQKPRRCQKCDNPTREFKPLCSDHIEEMSYASQLIEKQEAIEAEITSVNKRGEKAIPEDSPVVRELIKLLKFESMVLGKIYKHVSSENFTFETSKVYVNYLERHGYVELTSTGRSYEVDLIEDQVVLRKIRSGAVAKALGFKRMTVTGWIKKGAPHRLEPAEDPRFNKYFFNLEEVRAWHDAYIAEGYKTRRGHYTISEETWEEAISRLKDGGSMAQTAEVVGISLGALQKYVQKHKISLSEIDPLKKRKLDRYKLAEALEISPLTVKKWVDEGLPHDKIRNRAKHPLLLFNEDEVREWAKKRDEESRARRAQATADYHARTRLTPEFWAAFMVDYRAGMTMRDLGAKHHISWPTINSYLKSKGISRKKKRTVVFWKSLINDYQAGMTMGAMMKKYKLGRTAIENHLSKNKINRKNRFTQQFWDEVIKDFHARMQIKDICRKHNIGHARFKKYLRDNNITRTRHSAEFWEKVVENYHNTTLSVKALAKRHRITPATLQNYLTENKISRTPLKQQRYTAEFWNEIVSDYHKGVPIRDICQKHKIGHKKLTSYLQTNGIEREPHRQAG